MIRRRSVSHPVDERLAWSYSLSVCRRNECPSTSALSDWCSVPSAGFAGATCWEEVRKGAEPPPSFLGRRARMRRRQHCWAGCLILMATLTDLLLIGHLSAQAPGQGLGTLGQAGAAADEITPRLFTGPDGQVFRLWQRWADLRTGGGGVFLSVASTGATWKKVLEILPSEPGVTALDPDIAFGSSKEIAVAYQWRRHDPRTKQVRMALSDDGGQTWNQSTTPIESSGKGFTPKVAWGRERSLVV